MNKLVFEQLTGYLEAILKELSLEERVKRLGHFKENPTLEGFISSEEASMNSYLQIHRQGLKYCFDLYAEGDKDNLVVWATNKLDEQNQIKISRETTRIKTRSTASYGRRIIVFLDGTSNTPEEIQHTKRYDIMSPPPITNVVRLLRGVLTDDRQTVLPQIIGYFRGVATEGSESTKLIDSVTGRGLSRTVLDAYRFISHNLEWLGGNMPRLGQDEIYIFGFSRGAYAARALNGFLNRLGLIKKESLWLLPFFFSKYQELLSTGRDFDARTEDVWRKNVHPEFESIPVKFIGVWDTVSALGIPVKGLSWMTKNYESFHDTSLTPNVTHAYQALAIHELRRPYKPILWTHKTNPSQVVEQVWFPGAHANIGGGYSQTGLSSYALDWMAYKAQQAGLELDIPYFTQEVSKKNLSEKIALSRNIGHGKKGFLNNRKLFWGVLERPVSHSNIPSYLGQNFPSQEIEQSVIVGIKAHWSVKERLRKDQTYADDKQSFKKLDKQSLKLPVLQRNEELVP